MRLARLDGIRGFAIIIVYAHHVLRFGPGWVGVDLFFVLSGYLITGILRRDRFEKRYWGPFYIKRAARILPALLVCFLLAALLTDFPWKRLWLPYVLFAANMAEAHSPLKGDPQLTILWSLAVEEQFYLFWPFAVRFCSRRTLIWILGAVLCVEPLLRAAFTSRIGWWPMYILTPFRLDGLAAGSLLAIVLEERKWADRLGRSAGPLALLALGVYGLSSLIPGFWYRADSLSFNVFGYSLIAAIGVFGLAYVLQHGDSHVSRVLAHPALVFPGVVSYGLYLYHVMVVQAVHLFLLRIRFDHMRTVSPVTTALALGLAWVSYRFYERPILQLGHRAVQKINHRGGKAVSSVDYPVAEGLPRAAACGRYSRVGPGLPVERRAANLEVDQQDLNVQESR